jgi:CO/xanthine dehydrogenase Mo-binding subunit
MHWPSSIRRIPETQHRTRWLGVLKAVADASKWAPRVAASTVTSGKIAVGRGMGLGTHHLLPNQGDRITFAAAVVEIEVNKETGVVVAKHVYGAMDCGLAINPGIVESQIVGMSVHGTSLALKEEVLFKKINVMSLIGTRIRRYGLASTGRPLVSSSS